jgi:hypothetical protein
MVKVLERLGGAGSTWRVHEVRWTPWRFPRWVSGGSAVAWSGSAADPGEGVEGGLVRVGEGVQVLLIPDLFDTRLGETPATRSNRALREQPTRTALSA